MSKTIDDLLVDANLLPDPVVPKPKRKYNYTKKAGRPTTYHPKLCKQIILYFQKVAKTDYPCFEGFCVENHNTVSTLWEWEKKYPDFSKAVDECRALQKTMLIQKSLKEEYSSSFAKFIAINCHGMIEKSEVNNNITGGLDLKGGINITWTDGK
jgi:hypothetical protein